MVWADDVFNLIDNIVKYRKDEDFIKYMRACMDTYKYNDDEYKREKLYKIFKILDIGRSR